MAIDLDKLAKAFDEALAKSTPEEIRKYFPEDTTPKGWVSIEDHLPKWKVADIMEGCTKYKVRCADGREGMTCVSDHTMWYYDAKEAGITHWLNE